MGVSDVRIVEYPARYELRGVVNLIAFTQGQHMNFNASQIDPLALPSVPFLSRHLLPEVTGIYFLLSQIGEVLYIGQAQNICDRWKGHHRTPNVNSTHALKIAWVEVDSAFLNKVEAAWIKLYCPPLNGVAPLGRTKRKRSSNERLTSADLRARVGFSQQDLATALGMCLSAIAKWEQTRRSPKLTFSKTLLMTQILDCTLEELAEAYDRVNPDEF